MGPMNLAASVGHSGVLIVAMIIGFFFGYVLEAAGFGDSRKLAGQFYFTDLTVVKVMFTAIVVASLLIGISSGLGLIDIGGIFINPTFLGSGILGGLIMGVGFILGGYCPGTSLVSFSTGKIDAMFFVLGASIGMIFFAESVASFQEWFDTSGTMGRYTLPEFLGLSYGMTLMLVVLLALAMFIGFGALRKALYKPDEPNQMKANSVGALALVALAGLAIAIGQPTTDEKFDLMTDQVQKLKDRAVYIDPAELLGLMNNNLVRLHLLDLRDEADWNVFHIRRAEHTSMDKVIKDAKRLGSLPPSSVLVLTDNGEARSTDAWKKLIALKVPNVYILEGGINNWLSAYGKVHAHHHAPGLVAEVFHTQPPQKRAAVKPGALAYSFKSAVGEHHPAANPDAHHAPHRDFTKKVKLVAKKKLSGGCG